MGFTSVIPFNFRNLENRKVALGEKNILFIGENGQGKTNSLEMLYLLCFGSSFRTRKDTLLVTHGQKEMSVHGEYSAGDGENFHIGVVFKDGKKSILLNGKRIADRADLLSVAPCIVFTHEDIAYINGPPDNQRTFFNQTVSLCEPSFIQILRTYHRIIRMRNLALADGRNDLLDIYDTQLVPGGFEIMDRRREAADEFNAVLTPLYREISGLREEVYIRYRSSWPEEMDNERILSFLRERRGLDEERRITTTGPHRDRFRIFMGNVDFRTTASTGQMRLLSLVYRVVQAIRYHAKTGRKPILLLDDVLLELDTGKRERFLDRLPEYEQAFFTFLPDERYGRYRFDEKKIYSLKEGRVEDT